MRTKTILAAAAGMLCAASVLAVTSVNVVGYVNVPLTANQFTLLANPLQASPNNHIGTVIPAASLPGSGQGTTTFFKFNTATVGYDEIDYDVDVYGGWSDLPGDGSTFDIAPGQGFWIKVPVNTTLTFVGDVLQGNQPIPLVPGFQMLGSKWPATDYLWSATVGQGLGFSPSTGGTDRVFLWNYPNPLWNEYDYDINVYGGWNDLQGLGPKIPIATGFWLAPGDATTSWIQNFTVQ